MTTSAGACKCAVLAFILGALVLGTVAAQAQGYTYVSQWGTHGGGDGQFNTPRGMAVDASGNVYVADTNNHRVQKFASDGSFLATWGSLGVGDGQFDQPTGVAVDGFGNVYVADHNNHRIQKLDASGGFLTKWGTPGAGDGQFDGPFGVAVDTAGDVYVTDNSNSRVQKFNSDGAFITKWGSHGDADGQFRYAKRVTVDGSGNVYVTDSNNHRMQKFTSGGDFIAKWGAYGSGDGQLYYPYGVATDAAGDVYVADTLNNRMQKFAPDGSFITKWGSYGTADGQFDAPHAVAVGASGNVYVADADNHRIQVFAPPNNPPTQPTVVIAPTSPTCNDSLRATASGSIDPDGDPVTYSYRWFKNGVEQAGVTWRTIGAWRTRRGQVWRCVVTPNDGFEDGPTGEDQVNVDSTISQPTVTFTPADPVNSDSLRANASGSVDSDGDPITYKYKWFKNGVEQVGVTWKTIGAWRRRPGQAWRCVVTPTDGTNNGPTGEDTVTMRANTPPTAPTVVIAPANPTTAQSFRANASGSTDADGDPITYSYQWYKNGVLRQGVTWPRLGPNRTRPGQVWRCVVTPNDGFDDGPTGEATVTVKIGKDGALTVSSLAATPTGGGAEVAFTLSVDASVTCEVLNIAGRAVKTIVADRPMDAGINSLAWDGRNAAGLRAPGGMYLVRMTATTTGGARWTSMGTLSLTR